MTHIDFLGQTLEVGDTVVRALGGFTDAFIVLTISDVTNKMIRVKTNKKTNKLVYARSCIKVDPALLTFKELMK